MSSNIQHNKSSFERSNNIYHFLKSLFWIFNLFFIFFFFSFFTIKQIFSIQVDSKIMGKFVYYQTIFTKIFMQKSVRRKYVYKRNKRQGRANEKNLNKRTQIEMSKYTNKSSFKATCMLLLQIGVFPRLFYYDNTIFALPVLCCVQYLTCIMSFFA